MVKYFFIYLRLEVLVFRLHRQIIQKENVHNWKSSLIVRSWKQLVGESGIGWNLRITEVVISYSATNIENVFFNSKCFGVIFFFRQYDISFFSFRYFNPTSSIYTNLPIWFHRYFLVYQKQCRTVLAGKFLIICETKRILMTDILYKILEDSNNFVFKYTPDHRLTEGHTFNEIFKKSIKYFEFKSAKI